MELPLPPGPRAVPIVGHLPWFAADPLGYMQRAARRYGDVFRIRLGRSDYVFLNHPELVDRLVRTHSAQRSDLTRNALRSYLGDGLLALEGPDHLRHRRLMQPAFQKERIRGYGAFMLDEAYAATERLAATSAPVELSAEMSRLTLQVVTRALFSTDTARETRDINAAIRVATPYVMNFARLSTLFGRSVPATLVPKVRRAITHLRGVTEGLVAARRAQGGDAGDLLSMLVKARDEDGGRLSDRDVTDELLTMLFAGHETTAHTLLWTFSLLLQNPHVLRKLEQEIDSVAPGRALTIDDLPELKYTECVVKEALRLYPPAWWADRVPAEDSDFGGFHVAKGQTVVFSVYVMQRDARFFPNPATFEPERFSPERARSMPAGAYLPFGAGVHVCIGAQFALLEARLVLAALVQRLRVESRAEKLPKPNPTITLEPGSAFPVVFKRR